MIIGGRSYSRGIPGSLAFMCCLFLVLGGCNKPKQESATATTGTQLHHLKGRVLSADRHDNTITVDGENIPGFMEAMIMPYTVKDKSLLDKLLPGDEITAEIVMHDDDSWLESVKVIGHTAPQKPAATVHIPSEGEAVPDFQFTNQDGRAVSLQSFHGKVVVLTFIYTRCPFPDYCPRMTHEFSEICNQLQNDHLLLGKTQLLSISIDPAHDTPKALKAYGLALPGSNQADFFHHWEFVVPSVADLSKVTNYFGLAYSQEKDTLTHSLITAVIAPDGRIFKWYHGSEWQPADVLKDAADALQSASAHKTP